MALTRLQMANEVLDNLSRDGSATTRSGVTLSTMAVRWLNRAQRQIARKYDMLFKTSTSSTVDGQQTYSFPSNLRAVFSIKLESGINSRKLTCVMPWEFDNLVPLPSNDTETISKYYVPYKASNQFELYKIPDAAYTLRMRHSIWPTDLATDSSNTDYAAFNIDLDDALIFLATSYGFKYLQELVDARSWRKDGWDRVEEVWMAERESFPDWAPSGRGFTVGVYAPPGEYYNNPFISEGGSYGGREYYY